MKKLKLKDKYYLVNHENFFEFDENDVIQFIDFTVSDEDIIGEAKVYNDNRGLYILQENNLFGTSEDTGYNLKKFYETGGEFEVEIKVLVDNLKVDHFYFSFDFKIYVNGKQVADDQYESTHSWQDGKKSFYNMLKNGHAAHCALEYVNLDLG